MIVCRAVTKIKSRGACLAPGWRKLAQRPRSLVPVSRGRDFRPPRPSYTREPILPAAIDDPVIVYASSVKPCWHRVIAVVLIAFGACKERDPIADLARIDFPRRPVEARLCGGFRWAPVDEYTRKDGRELSSNSARRSQFSQ